MLRTIKLPAITIQRSASLALFLLALFVWTGILPAYAQNTQSESQGRVLSESEMMMAGAQANRLDVVVYFLNRGVDPNSTAKKGFTALMVAAAKGNTSIAGVLLARGADVNKANDVGWTALMEAAFRDRDTMVKQLLKAGARLDVAETKNGLSPLMIAAKGDRPDSVTAMLGAGADAKAGDRKRGLTALHHALASSKYSSSEIAAELLVSGADPEHKAKDGYTPLMSAVDSGKAAKISLVLSESVDVNAQTNDGRSALIIAAGNGHQVLVKRLLKAGARVDRGGSRITALTQAIRIGSWETVAALLAHGADPNRPAADGRNPLILAARGGYGEIVRQLLDKGGDVNGRNVRDGTTALMWAANNGRRRIVDLLLERGANPSIAARDGWTAGAAARMAGHDEIAGKLEQQI